jgi:hypothetical protein
MILLSLMGEQPIPNLIPLWQFHEYTGTQFAATSTTHGRALMLAEAIARDHQLKRVKVLEPLKLEAYDLQKARLVLARAITELHQEDDVCLNLTGGTKIMSLAALQAAYGSGIPLMYVASEQNEIIFYQSDGVETRRQPIDVQISVRQYLEACGLENSLTQNFLPPDPNATLPPPKEGDYLENRVVKQALDSGLFDDVQRGVFVRRRTERGDVINELDVVVTRHARLAICSCKARKKITNDMLYELAALSSRENLGIYCGKLLVTSTTDLTESLFNRARANRIHLVDNSQMDRIAFYLMLATD